MVGQEKLLNKLHNYSIDSFPRSVILLGEKGSGKHLIAKYISENIINLPLLDITDNISNEYLDMIYRNPNPTIYLIDMSKMTEKEQNILLKFTEEPLTNSFVILLCEAHNSVLNTILNRCLIFELERYTKAQLSSFLDVNYKENEDLILSILKTPGKVKSANLSHIQEIYTLCQTIANKLSVASYPNTLTIVDKLNYKDMYDKYDIDVFFDTLLYVLFEEYLKGNSIMYNLYTFTIRERFKYLMDVRLNKELFMINYLTKLWKLVKR
jgi:DNA polymerase III delta prime subunit